ncbi:hypothetical protein Zmor_011494 [Zophobas morio]|uniref:Uncharacterized protein n=1 Tax=Zophobas morio TaxID=2755281 RepID=A0AA38MKZ7_9CUCU|nr:hypothetical protein Zmor_011494 [Zophobas morio]
MVDGLYNSTVSAAQNKHMSIRFGCNFSYVIFSFIWLYTLIARFSQVQEISNEGAFLVHGIWNKWTSRGKLDQNLCCLKLISLQMITMKASFSIGGFFTFDWKFFQQMLAGVSVYLVILIQFYI